jgi:uncharacterized protein with PIN domain
MDLCFAADRALGKLVKWLRILGYDTIYESDFSSQWFFEHLEEDRILITRTEKILKKFPDHKLVFIKSNDLEEQLKQIIKETGIRLKEIRPFSRCLHCNRLLVDIDKNDVYNQVPSYIWETHDKFHMCRQCERIYWPGSHAERSMQRVERLFK